MLNKRRKSENFGLIIATICILGFFWRFPEKEPDFMFFLVKSRCFEVGSMRNPFSIRLAI